MKKLLVVGAGIEQVPAIKQAKEYGLEVIVTDISENAPGIGIADKSYRVSTNDPEGNLKIAEKENIDGIITLCSETAVPVVAHVSSKLGLPGISEFSALAATNKGFMRQVLSRNHVPLTGYEITGSYEELLAFTDRYNPPWVVKPSDSSGQRGVKLISEKSELKASYLEAVRYSTDGKVMVEEYVYGPEINVTCLVIDGQVKILSLSERITLPAPHFGIAIMHLAPPTLKKEEMESIQEQAIRSTEALDMKNGVSYPQFIATKEGPKLLEIAARIPGGNMREVAMYLSGVDMIKTIIKQALGEKLTFSDAVTEEIFPAVAVRFITSLDIHPVGKAVTRISGLDDVSKTPGIKYCQFRLEPGQVPPPLSNSSGRFGSIIAVGNTREEVMEKVNTAFNKIIVS